MRRETEENRSACRRRWHGCTVNARSRVISCALVRWPLTRETPLANLALRKERVSHHRGEHARKEGSSGSGEEGGCGRGRSDICRSRACKQSTCRADSHEHTSAGRRRVAGSHGRKAQGNARTHTHAHARTRTHPRTHTDKHKCAHAYTPMPHTRTRTHAHHPTDKTQHKCTLTHKHPPPWAECVRCVCCMFMGGMRKIVYAVCLCADLKCYRAPCYRCK